MADALAYADEAELAGYVDSGIWMLEEWLLDQGAETNVRNMFLRDLWRDCFGDTRNPQLSEP